MDKREWVLRFVLENPFYDTEDTVGASARLYDAIVAATTDEGWVEHRGEKPYPEGRVEVKLRNGSTYVNDADMFIWTHGDMGVPSEDIIAWRPAR